MPASAKRRHRSRYSTEKKNRSSNMPTSRNASTRTSSTDADSHPTMLGWSSGRSAHTYARVPGLPGQNTPIVACIAAWDQLGNRRFDGCTVPSGRSEEHTSELQSLIRISYAVFCLKTKNTKY